MTWSSHSRRKKITNKHNLVQFAGIYNPKNAEEILIDSNVNQLDVYKSIA